ncbi:hypothetical protein G7046_g2898 [Stylonectria norvegica]|nr:hypothetical protein G7046_g2898 [Stylonectria norvegica]
MWDLECSRPARLPLRLELLRWGFTGCLPTVLVAVMRLRQVAEPRHIKYALVSLRGGISECGVQDFSVSDFTPPGQCAIRRIVKGDGEVEKDSLLYVGSSKALADPPRLGLHRLFSREEAAEIVSGYISRSDINTQGLLSAEEHGEPIQGI